MRIALPMILTVLLIPALTPSLQAWQGRVVEVLDTRTLLVDSGDRKVRASLYGLGVPELDEPYGPEAEQALKEMSLGKNVSLSVQPTSPESKVAAVITVLETGVSLNEALLKQGLAWVWEAYCEKAVLCGRWERLQGQARASGQGFWPLIPENRPAWKWLREHSGQ
jgi:endonuclease YncB( thermonuclease family)